jgi:hypothetical protein
MPAPLPAEVRIVPARRGTARPRRWLLVILGVLALVVLVANVPGLGLSMPAPAARHHAAARPRPVPPPPVRVTVGQRAYSCTVVLPPASIKGRP